jgi:hypothetical protein
VRAGAGKRHISTIAVATLLATASILGLAAPAGATEPTTVRVDQAVAVDTEQSCGTACTKLEGYGISIAGVRLWKLSVQRTYHNSTHIGWCGISGTWRLERVGAPETFLAGTIELGTTALCSHFSWYWQVTSAGGEYAGMVSNSTRQPFAPSDALLCGYATCFGATYNGSLEFSLVPG